MAVELRDPEASAAGTEGRKERRRAARRGRLKLFLQGLSVLAAFAGAGLVAFFVGGLAGEQDTSGTAVPPTAADPLSQMARGGAEILEQSLAPATGSPSVPEAAPDFDTGALEDRLQEIAEGHQGVYGVAVLEPDSGTRISLRGDEEFVVASIGKLPPFAALYRAAARGELDLDETISIQPKDFQSYGSGSLHGYPEGHSLTLREAAYFLVNHSDNTAWAMLDRRLGEEEIKEELEGAGVQDSRYQGHLDGYYTTPDDVLLLLEKISDPAFTNQELSDEMLDAMTETVFEDRIPEKLPSDVRVAHKIGSYGVNFGDAGVVFYKDQQGVEKHYYLVVLSEGAGEYEARDVIQEMSLAVYEALTGTQVDSEWSRGGETSLESSAETPPAAPTPTPPSAPAPAEKAGGERVENAAPAVKPPLQEKPPPKVEPKVEKQSSATRYGASFYPPPEYEPYYDRATQDSEGYYYYETLPEEDPYWEEY